jgi:hypothetical protein
MGNIIMKMVKSDKMNGIYKETDDFGIFNVMYYVNDVIHRPHEEGPAFNNSNGVSCYYENGVINRPYKYGPAIRTKNGITYVVNGEKHRPHEIGPAKILTDGSTFYFENGKLHRPSDVGPAKTIMKINGEIDYEEYWEYGKQVLVDNV